MKCIRCNANAKKKDRDRKHGRCPACGHRFVTKPEQDGFTDRTIQSAQTAVSGNGAFYFLKAHLAYELRRRLKKKRRQALIAAFLVSSLLFFVFHIVISDDWFAALVFLVPLVWIFQYTGKHKRSLEKIDAIADVWLRVNPHEKLLIGLKFQNRDGDSADQQLEEISFDRVLICDRSETADFLLSNLFHFHYACPVLGGDGYPPGVCADMLKRLKRNPRLKVFLLHDYSPEGYAFVRRMRNDATWFGAPQSYEIIDLGLIQEQKKMFGAMMVRRNHRNIAELTLFKPAALMTLLGAAINEGVPLHRVSSNAAGSSDGYG